MRTALIVAIVVNVVCSIGPGNAAEPVPCAVVPSEPGASAAFDTFCRRCHDSKKLAISYFARADSRVADRRETELAAFLDRHSACPHRHHEEIAAWLRKLSSQQ